jgi:hypothetical protein
LIEPDLNIAVDLFDTAAQLLDPVYCGFDPSSQLAHLCLDAVHSQFRLDRGLACWDGLTWTADAINLTLQHSQISLYAVQAVLRCPLLRPHRLARSHHGGCRQQQSQDNNLSGMPEDRTAYHKDASRIRA